MRRSLPRVARIAGRSAEWVGRARTLTVPTGLIELSADCMHRVVWKRPPYACQCRRPIGPRRRPACRVAQGWSRWYRGQTIHIETLDMDTRSSGQSATGGDLTGEAHQKSHPQGRFPMMRCVAPTRSQWQLRACHKRQVATDCRRMKTSSSRMPAAIRSVPLDPYRHSSHWYARSRVSGYT